jgi:hypothetical protein
MLQRDELLFAVFFFYHGMPVAEGAAFHILTGNAHGVTFVK